jgi:hypothetical protein
MRQAEAENAARRWRSRPWSKEELITDDWQQARSNAAGSQDAPELHELDASRREQRSGPA